MSDDAAPDAYLKAEAVFWDFDGVIKESVEAKANAYVALFDDRDESVRARVRDHHNGNGGMSRFDKIPLYMEWAGLELSTVAVAHYLARFADLVVDKVITADWVPGVERLLRETPQSRPQFLVTATPTDEIEVILASLSLRDAFIDIRGAPEKKTTNTADLLARHSIRAETAVLIGDSISDYDAAAANGMGFILRQTALNSGLQQRHSGPQVKDFTGWTNRIPSPH